MHFKKGNLFGKFVKEGWCTMDETSRSSYNFCDFFKAIGWGLLWTFALFYFVGWLLVLGLPAWLLYFFSDFPIPFGTDFSWGANIHLASSIFGGAVILVVVFGTLAYCDWQIKEWHYNYHRRQNKLPPTPPREPTWFQEAYEGFKEKYCPLVTFEE